MGVAFLIIVIIAVITLIIITYLSHQQEQERSIQSEIEFRRMMKEFKPEAEPDMSEVVAKGSEYYNRILNNVKIPIDRLLVTAHSSNKAMICTRHYFWSDEKHLYFFPTSEFLDNPNLIDHYKIRMFMIEKSSIERVYTDDEIKATIIQVNDANYMTYYQFEYADLVTIDKVLLEGE